MPLRLGSTPITSVKLGSTDIREIRLGSTLVWSRSSLRDDFNRDNSVGLGANWTNHGPASSPYYASVLNNYARLNIPDGLISLSLQTSRWRYTAAVMPSDNGRIETRVAVKGDNGWDRITQLFGWLSTDFASGVGIRLDGSIPSIVRRVSGTETVMASGTTYNAGDVLQLRKNGTVYSLYRNGTFVVQWNDSGNTAVTGAGNRSLGVVFTGTKDTLGPRRFSAALDYVAAA
ncbi:glycosyl hydrolase [Gordonia phage MossRose]|nr:glycosyl hydrolase [Gordonia phage MossRose]